MNFWNFGTPTLGANISPERAQARGSGRGKNIAVQSDCRTTNYQIHNVVMSRANNDVVGVLITLQKGPRRPRACARLGVARLFSGVDPVYTQWTNLLMQHTKPEG